MEEALQPVVDFRRYKVTDSAAVREFYSLLRAAIKGAKAIGRLSLLINDQTIPKIMSKMPYTDWKEWATKRPDWMQQDMTSAFERFVERKWQDALNIAAAELASWSMGREKLSSGGGVQDKIAPISKGTLKVTGAVNVVEQKASPRPPSPSWDVSFGRKCRARNLIRCDGEHVLLQCSKLLGMKLSERKEVLEKSGLCLFCLKHAAELECYGRGGLSKRKCARVGCDGEHTPSIHELMGEESASVNLVAEDNGVCDSEEDEEWWVGTVRMEEVQERGGETLEEMDESELESLWDAPVPSYSEAPEESRWWSPEPPQASSKEDEEEVQYLMYVLGLGSQGNQANQGTRPAPKGTKAGPEEDTTAPRRREPARPKGTKRRKPRKKAVRSLDQEWEQARQDAWLREMLTDTSESENEEKCGRFAESGRWITELFGIPQQVETTSRGECSGQKTPDSS
jgi:hypothetical protein